MNINISGHHLDLTPSLREYVNTKLSKLERHFDKITSTQVILSVDNDEQKAEANVHVSGADLFAQSQHSDMYAAIDSLSDKLDRQIIKHKEKLRGRKKGRPAHLQAEMLSPEPESDS